jgi:hypothetical protein
MHVSPDHLLVAGRADSRDLPAVMIDREKVVAILRKRFPNAPAVDIAAAANAIVGLGDEWREVENFESDVEQQLGKCSRKSRRAGASSCTSTSTDLLPRSRGILRSACRKSRRPATVSQSTHRRAGVFL